MPHPFLSDEWLAAAREIRSKHADAVPPGVVIRMNQIITEAPFDGGEIHTFVDTSSGEFLMEKGELADADVTVTTDYETARKIFVDQDTQAAMQAFVGGKIKVQGDMMKLMAMQANPPAGAAALAEEIKNITA